MTPMSFDYPISVAILYSGGSSADDQDTLESVNGITESLTGMGHMVRIFAVTRKNWRKAVRIPGDVVFNLVEDQGWEMYVKVGVHLEMLGRAQVGHDLRCFKYIATKAGMKRKMERLGISTPGFRIFNRRSHINQVRGLEYPLIVKPSGEHAGVGISQDSVVIDQDELNQRVKYLFKNYPGKVLAEEFIDGREIHVTVIGNGRHIVCLPFSELNFKGEFADNWNVYTYDAKWEKESWEYWNVRVSAPARVHKKLSKKIEKLSLAAYRAFGCRDIARMDIRIDEKEIPYVVDVNMMPSLNKFDDEDATLESVKALGWSYDEFLETVIAMTYKRVYGRLPKLIRERHFLLSAPVRV